MLCAWHHRRGAMGSSRQQASGGGDSSSSTSCSGGAAAAAWGAVRQQPHEMTKGARDGGWWWEEEEVGSQPPDMPSEQSRANRHGGCCRLWRTVYISLWSWNTTAICFKKLQNTCTARALGSCCRQPNATPGERLQNKLARAAFAAHGIKSNLPWCDCL